MSIPRPADNPRSYVQRLLYDALRNPAPAVPPRGSAFNGTRPLCAVDPGSSVFPPGAISLAMPRDINTLLRKDALMKVDKRSEKYVHQPSRRRRRPSRRRVSRRGERSGGGSVHALRTPARPCCRSRAAAQGEGREGRDGGGIHQTPFVLMNLPDNGARSMNYVPRGFESERNRGSSPLIRRSPLSARRAHSTTRQVSPPFGERRFAVTSLCARGRSRFAREKLSFGESEDSSPSFSFSVHSVGRVMGGGELSEWKRVWDF